ncbi:hypothetical protein [Nocardia sp. XZ_19_369]|uniref:hypothetical protein n=1 Tax=Nocardia sp. XZ_19_369 TaxID=2769487 RepID=UPI001890656A|nr:hypothetical protein [Nocardia sp. XZ_19_369]
MCHRLKTISAREAGPAADLASAARILAFELASHHKDLKNVIASDIDGLLELGTHFAEALARHCEHDQTLILEDTTIRLAWRTYLSVRLARDADRLDPDTRMRMDSALALADRMWAQARPLYHAESCFASIGRHPWYTPSSHRPCGTHASRVRLRIYDGNAVDLVGQPVDTPLLCLNHAAEQLAGWHRDGTIPPTIIGGTAADQLEIHTRAVQIRHEQLNTLKW